MPRAFLDLRHVIQVPCYSIRGIAEQDHPELVHVHRGAIVTEIVTIERKTSKTSKTPKLQTKTLKP